MPAEQIMADIRAAKHRPVTQVVPLTDTEHAVLQLAAGGMETTEIAGRLYIGASTVKTHLTAVYVKLGARNRAEAVAIAASSGLLATAVPVLDRPEVRAVQDGHAPEPDAADLADQAPATTTPDTGSEYTTIVADPAAAPAGLDLLLAAGDASPHKPTRDLANKIRDYVADLRMRVAGEQAETAARTRVAEARGQLGNGGVELAAITHTTDKPVRPDATVRAWAKATGVACPTHGRVPGTLVQAWRDATGGA